ncbi:MAG: cation:proton antiporter [Actinomycetota bacterium]|nr:cation:proton antiporter [Actinomycetota bacterium]
MSVLSVQALLGLVLFDLIVILVLARSVGTLFTRFGQPRVVGEIVAGVLLGPTLLGPALWPQFTAPAFLHCIIQPGIAQSPTSCLFPAPPRAVIGQLGQLGLLLFSFLTAVELDRALLSKRIGRIALVGSGSVLLPIVVVIPLKPILVTPVFKPASVSTIGFTLFVGVMLAATALPVMVRILQELGLSQSPLGCTGIAASAVATVGLFVVASIALSIAGMNGAGTGGVEVVFRTLALAVGYLGLMLLMVRPLLTRMAHRLMSPAHDPGGVSQFVGVLVLLLSSGLAAHLAGLTVIVGGFLAGLILPAQTAVHCALEQRLGELTRSVLLPIFLAFSGLQTDLTAVPITAYGALLLLLACAMVSKWGGGAVLARASGLSWPESNVLGILMNCPGMIVLVIALVGIQHSLITPAMQAGIVLVALASTVMTGPLLRTFLTLGLTASLVHTSVSRRSDGTDLR